MVAQEDDAVWLLRKTMQQVAQEDHAAWLLKKTMQHGCSGRRCSVFV
jgi:hypothetical protein